MMTYSLDGFAHSAESLSGYYFGAKRKKDFRRACFFSTIWSVVLALAIFVVYFLFAEAFIGFMTISEDVRKTALLAQTEAPTVCGKTRENTVKFAAARPTTGSGFCP